MYYNVRLKRFPNGKLQYQYYEFPKQFDYEVEKKERTGKAVERKEHENARRAVQKVYDLAHSNLFEYFLTLTFDGTKIDRYSYDACADAVKMFTDIMRHNGNKWSNIKMVRIIFMCWFLARFPWLRRSIRIQGKRLWINRGDRFTTSAISNMVIQPQPVFLTQVKRRLIWLSI